MILLSKKGVTGRLVSGFYTCFLLAALGFPGASLLAQPLNDDCSSAIHLNFLDSYCSEVGQFSNVGATPSGQLNTSCLVSLENEVWFTLIPQAPAWHIQVNGAVNGLGTMQGPGIFLFEGTCGNLTDVGCNTVSTGLSTVELTVTDLVIGAVYYLAVQGSVAGSFQVCVDAFIPPPEPSGDCSKAVVLCDKSPFFIEHLSGVGDPLINEVNGTCLREELSSTWYKWTCEQSGTLTFTLTPNNFVPGYESDDLDFIVYELPGGLNDCSNKQILRCEAAGANTTNGGVDPLSTWIQCNGPTGLRDGESDFTEPGGCQGGNNNWVAPINMVAGKSYALIINNYSQSGLGFSIEFGGSGTFLGPEPDFDIEAVEAFECDKTIIFTNLSSSMTDSIVSWSWNFGAGATPLFISGQGPHDVIYESFGPKRAALTVKTARGCIVTRILDLFVDPCCADTTTLDVGALAEDLLCPGVPTGVITGIGSSGAPPYQFSLNDSAYQPSTVFPGLGPGIYEVFIQDSKGCKDSTEIEVMDGAPFGVEAGDTIFVDLGQPAQINAMVFPGGSATIIDWFPPDGLNIGSDPLSPVAYAPGSTWYTIMVENADGCIAIDSVLVLVNIVRPVYIPNVFSPNFDRINDIFYIQGSPAATSIEIMRVFDRWGDLLYESPPNTALNDESFGWDGTFKGKPMNPGVYTYYASILFQDREVVTYSGTITLVR